MIIPRLAVAIALLGAVAPLAGASCLPTCEVGSTAFGYAPAATTIQSGDNVTWGSLDLIAHTVSTSRFCLNLGITAETPATAYFRIQSGSLQAATDPNATWKTCPEAIGLPGGSFALAYKCLYHQPQQNGLVVVTP